MENTQTTQLPLSNAARTRNLLCCWFGHNITRSLYILLSVSSLLLGGCNSGSSSSATQTFQPQAVPLSELELKPASDCADLQSYIKQSLIKQYTRLPQFEYCSTTAIPVDSGTAGGGAVTPAPAPSPAAGGSAGAATNGSGPTGVSDTNNQEPGVNEGDIVKSDDAGNVYMLTGRHLIIAKGYPPQNLATLKQIDLGARGVALYLDKINQRLAVIAREQTPYYITDPVPLAADAIASPVRAADYFIAIFLDVTDPANPAVLKQLQFRGYYQDGRRIDNRIHIVSRYYMQLNKVYGDTDLQTLSSTYWTTVQKAACDISKDGAPRDAVTANPAVKAARASIADKINTLVDTLTPQDYLPDALQSNNGTLQPISYLSCQDIQHPSVDMNLGLQIVSSIDSDGNNLAATGIVNNAWITYASTNSLYLANTSYNWWWYSDSNQPPTSQTAIYKFDISSGKPQYVAAGRVDGYAKDQFSFSEYNGDLRVATTENDVIYSRNASGLPVWTPHINNNLFVLQDDNAGKLNVVGKVRDFVPDETIRSARFFGDKGFVITYKNIDPLFAFDLADPTNPKMVGELTLPGYGSYIHAYDDNHIMTIGRADTSGGMGVLGGLQLQLIDISDIAKPSLMYSYTPTTATGWSWSDAEYDHKAFTFYKPANVLAIPMMVAPGYNAPVFNGIAAFEVTLNNGFKPLGMVDHSDLAKDYYCGGTALLPAYQPDCSDGMYVWWAAPRRSVVMMDTNNVYLYTISDVGMKVADTADLSTTIGKIVFPYQPYPWWYFGLGGVTSGTTSSTGGTTTSSGGSVTVTAPPS